MSRPPLVNLFAYRDDDPAELEHVARDLATSGEFAEVWRPAPGWVVAVAPLPGSDPDGPIVRSHRLAFAEGRDRVVPDGEGAREACGRIAGLVAASPDRLAQLPGDFGFLHFSAQGGITVVRSCGGLVPFYLWGTGARRAVATRLGDIVRYVGDEPVLDPLVNAAWSTSQGIFPDQRTFLAGVSILARGSFASLDGRSGWNGGPYWNPRRRSLPGPTPATAREHAVRLRTLLLEKLAHDLDPAAANLLTLSGGVDSSSLGALAAGTLGLKVSTWSLLPSPDDLYQRELSFIEPLSQACGFERRWVVRLTPSTRVELIRAAHPTAFLMVHPALCDLSRVTREASVRVLFGGEFADEVCGSMLTLADWIDQTSFVRLLAALGRLPSGPRDVLRWSKRKALSIVGRPRFPLPETLGDFVRAEVREEYREWRDRRRRCALADSDPRRDLAMRAEIDGFVAMNWEACSALAMRRSFPFFNREVLELAFECHPAELVGPGTKRLLREALSRDVPARNLHREDKGGWGTYLHDAALAWNERLAESLAPIVRDDWHPLPPASLRAWQASVLTQYVVFDETIRMLRRARPGRRTVLACRKAVAGS